MSDPFNDVHARKRWWYTLRAPDGRVQPTVFLERLRDGLDDARMLATLEAHVVAARSDTSSEVQAASDRATRYGILGKTLDVSKAVDRGFTAGASLN